MDRIKRIWCSCSSYDLFFGMIYNSIIVLVFWEYRVYVSCGLIVEDVCVGSMLFVGSSIW